MIFVSVAYIKWRLFKEVKKDYKGVDNMPQRHTVPPESEKEKFIFGLTMPQLMWAAGGIGVSFGTVLLISRIQGSIWVSLLFGVPIGLAVLPFMFYRPKEKTLSFMEYMKYKWEIKRRNNELPNKSIYRAHRDDSDVSVLSTDGQVNKKDVRNIDITLGGGD